MVKYHSVEIRKARRAQNWDFATEVLGAILCIALMIFFCSICMLCSGYHWE